MSCRCLSQKILRNLLALENICIWIRLVSVFDRALNVQFRMLMSFAQDGINPKRMVVKWRDFFALFFANCQDQVRWRNVVSRTLLNYGQTDSKIIGPSGYLVGDGARSRPPQ